MRAVAIPFTVMEKWDLSFSSVCRSVNVMLVVSVCCCNTFYCDGEMGPEFLKCL